MGRPQFEAVVANAPKEKMTYTDLTQSSSVAVNGSQLVELFAPTGYIAELQSMMLSCTAPIGSVSGSHAFLFGYPGFDLIRGESNFNKDLHWVNSYWTADKRQDPPVGQTQVSAIKGAIFDDIVPLRIIYYNWSNVVQTNERKIRILYKLRQVAK